ncbi:hypothetical protein Gpo141_00004488 [Globisporangium polare]
MEGYLIRIPRDAWLGGRDPSSPRQRGSSKKRGGASRAQLLYYVLGEGYLRGYTSPDRDSEPVDTFQLTSFHVQVDPMYSMLMFEVFATPKTKDAIPAPAPADDKRPKASNGNDSSDDSNDDSESEDTGANAAGSKQQESSILLFAPNKTLVQTWGSRVLNWNRYVFGSFGSSSADADDDDSGEHDTKALEASRLELLAAFQHHQSASWFARPLALKSADPPVATTRRSKTGASFTSSRGPLPVTPTKQNDGNNEGDLKPAAPPSKPWWVLNSSQTRRISSNSLRK